MKINADLFKKAYKKLKSSVYFDKTQLVLRDKIVAFESEIEDIDAYFEDLCQRFLDNEQREMLAAKILDSISVLYFPKSLKLQADDGLIKNYMSDKAEIENVQYFIEMSVEGHILSILWLMLIGYRIDRQVYEHSYGNRIRKKLINEFSKKPTYSPYLFEPYFEQYESWRDIALDHASKNLFMGEDVVILTMDFQRFYYSVDMSQDAFDQLYRDALIPEDEHSSKLRELNDLMYQILEKYSRLFDCKEFDGRNILPIGFLPSNVLANWCLRNFDKAVIDGWNPVYFGRYVDDVLIVDKVPHDSDIYKLAEENRVKAGDIIEYFLKQYSRWRDMDSCSHEEEEKKGLFYETEELSDTYVLNEQYNPMKDDGSRITIQNKKLKIFYFKSGETDALIRCFRDKIAKNKSEFRHMPEDEAVFQRDDYNEIYELKNDATLNKVNGIKSISIDRFALSKFLGKHLRIGGMIESTEESKFENDILKIFDGCTLIENYTTWEKVIEIFVINERFRTVKRFVEKIFEAIETIEYIESEKDNSFYVKHALYRHLESCIHRTFALVWTKESKTFYDELIRLLGEKGMRTDHAASRGRYCKTRMIDRSVLAVPVDMMIGKKVVSDETEVNLTRFYDVIEYTREKWENNYILYPYLLSMYDFSMITCVEQLRCEIPYENMEAIYKEQRRNYLFSNYGRMKEDSIRNSDKISVQKIKVKQEEVYQICVKNEKKNKLKVAIPNVRSNHKNFEHLINGSPDRTYTRYKTVSLLMNQAIDEKADMLVMPEAFVPFEWLTTLARTCAKNNLAVVTGIEHIRINDRILNLTAVILPYEDWNHKSAYLSFHLKKHFAPGEAEAIRGCHMQETEGSTYELYQWNECYFPVYCCYELSSIYDRSLFQSYADFLVAIEWSRNADYDRKILESLSGDIHCYCVQVNSSDHGDSCITQPSQTEEKDIIRTKGGKNCTVLTGEIDVKKLREFQLEGYERQKQNHNFKITPPEFDKDVIRKKIRGETLF